MDTNGDGQLVASEIPEERRRIFEFMASRMGLDPSKPIALSAVRDAAAQRMSGGESSDRRGRDDDDRRRDDDDDGDRRRRDDDDDDRDNSSTPLVPGFGNGQQDAQVPGFGEIAMTGLPGTAAAASQVDSRTREMAEGMFRRYDRNGSRVLEQDEWGEIRGDPKEIDRNRDGRITLDEFTLRVAEYTRSRSRGSDDERSRDDDSDESRDSDDSESTGGATARSYRFRSPTERLPAGLPGWYAERDKNGDGQVAMAEYSEYWSDDKAREFVRLDLDGDGVITPQEGLLNGAGGDDADDDDGGSSDSSSSPAPTPSGGSGSGGAETPWWMK
jgi:hypothetical protein